MTQTIHQLMLGNLLEVFEERDPGRRRTAIERIGATFEGVLRNHRVAWDTAAPTPRQTAVYSIIDEEWPGVAARLREKLDR